SSFVLLLTSGLALVPVSGLVGPRREIQGKWVKWTVPEAPAAILSCPGLGNCAQVLLASANGQTLVTGGADGKACLWPLPSCLSRSSSKDCKPWLCLPHPAAVSHLAITHDGDLFSGKSSPTFLAVASGQNVSLWDLREAQPQQPIMQLNHSARVTSVVAEGKVLGISDATGNLGVWLFPRDAPLSTEPVLQLTQRQAVRSIAISKGGLWILSAEGKGVYSQATLWDLGSLSSLEWPTGEDNISINSFSLKARPVGEWLQPLARFHHGSTILSLALTPTAEYFVTGSVKGSVRVFSWQEHRFVSAEEELWHGAPVTGLELTQDGRWLLSSSLDGQIKLWDFRSDYSDASAKFLHQGAMGAAALSADGAVILSSDGGHLPFSQYRIYAWPLEIRHSPLISFSMHPSGSLGTNRVRQMLLAPDGNSIVTSHAQGKLSLWNVAQRKQKPVLAWDFFDGKVEDMAHLPASGQLLAAISMPDGNGEIVVWNVPWHNVTADFNLEDQGDVELVARYSQPGCPAKSVIATTDSRWLLCGCNGTSGEVRILEFKKDGSVQLVRTVYGAPSTSGRGVQNLIFLRSGGRFAAATDSGICMFDILSTETRSETCFYPGGSVSRDSLAVSEDDLELYSGSSNGRVCIWSLQTNSPIALACYDQPGDGPKAVTAITTITGSSKIVASSENGMVTMWDARVGPAIQQVPLVQFKASSYMLRMCMSPDGTFIYTAGSEGYILVLFADSVPAYSQSLLTSELCRTHTCTSSALVSSGGTVHLPAWLAALPLHSLQLIGTHVENVAVNPPVSLRRANFSGSTTLSWYKMSSHWFSVPLWIDLRNTTGLYIPTIQGDAQRRVTDLNCLKSSFQFKSDVKTDFCVMRGSQSPADLCAKHFVSRRQTGRDLSDFVSGRELPLLTIILVDEHLFEAWLCDCPVGTFGVNGSSCEVCPSQYYCPAAGTGDVARNAFPVACPPGSGTPYLGQTKESSCECLPGFITSRSANSSFVIPMGEDAISSGRCTACPTARFSPKYGGTSCEACPFGYAGVTRGDASSCLLDWQGILFVIFFQIAAVLFVWGLVRQRWGIPIEDVRLQGGRVIVTTNGRHCILTNYSETLRVRFRGTGHPRLDRAERPFRMRPALGGTSFELLNFKGKSVTDRIDCSRGVFHLAFNGTFLRSGRLLPNAFLVPCFLLLCLWAGRQTKLWMWWMIWLFPAAILLAVLGVFLARASSDQPGIQGRVMDYNRQIQDVMPEPWPCPKGAGRAIMASDLAELWEFFRFFIGDRDMYYVASNIVKPITEEARLSFAEVVGPHPTDYFVSHYWGSHFQHFVESVLRHAKTVSPADWQPLCYWMCSLSNNQWRVSAAQTQKSEVRMKFSPKGDAQATHMYCTAPSRFPSHEITLRGIFHGTCSHIQEL
ncbi:unnamed protein product, partial [Polarella glacialis]